MQNKKIAIAIQTKICLCCGKEHKDDSCILIDRRFCSDVVKEEREKKMSQPSGYCDCNECKQYKEKGIIIIGYDENKSDMSNIPFGFYRTGEFIVITENGVNSLPIPDDIKTSAIKNRILFIPSELAKELIL